TLLNSKGKVSNTFYELYNEFKNHDIHFVAASGRQYHSIIHKLSPIKDQIVIIAENGGITKQGDNELLITDLPVHNVNEFIALIRNVNNVYAVLCSKDSAYIETRDEKFI